MTEINRQVTFDAPPMKVASALARSPWRAAMTIDPAGAGTRVTISASVRPEGLAASIEAMALAEVCHKRTVLQAGTTRETTRRTTMTTINRSVTINASAEEVWPALADFGGIATWNPSVKASKLTSDRTSGDGMTRECQLTPMGTVQERVTEWAEGRMITIDAYEFHNVPAMRSTTATLEIEPNGPVSTVNISLDYEVGLGPIGAGMNSMVMKRQFTKAVTGLLAGLKHHVETGQTVDSGTTLPLEAVSA